MKDATKVYYNNLLSLPLILILIWQSGEIDIIINNESMRDPLFLSCAILSGFFGFAVSFCAIKYLSLTTSTSYSMVGSLNKIPIAVLGWVLFKAEMSIQNACSVFIGLIAGIVFVKSKMMS